MYRIFCLAIRSSKHARIVSDMLIERLKQSMHDMDHPFPILTHMPSKLFKASMKY